MATEQGQIKKFSLNELSYLRHNGKIVFSLLGDDQVIGVALTDGQCDLLLMSSAGKVIRFSEQNVRSMGRVARGVRGIRMNKGQKIIALIIVDPSKTLLTVTENGYGQRTELEEYRIIQRGGQGVRAILTNKRNGLVVGAVQVSPDDDVLLMSSFGTLVRIAVKEISIIGRNTQGVRLIKLNTKKSAKADHECERLVEVAVVNEADTDG